MNINPNVRELLEQKYLEYNTPGFIDNDPVSIPHLFTRKEDIEIMGFWSAILAWGQRKTIINKSKELIALMDGAPFDFIKNHTENDLKPFLSFKHRTFNDIDTLCFLHFFKTFYATHSSLEEAFVIGVSAEDGHIGKGLENFQKLFSSMEDFPKRTLKHVSSPKSNSACKRINMFLRWMVRKDDKGVDFGIWEKIKPSQLICPCDVHVDRVARRLGLIERKQTDWKTALELTNNLKKLDAVDPVKYDFALFGLGVDEKFGY